MIDIKKLRKFYERSELHELPEIQTVDILINQGRVAKELEDSRFTPIQTKMYFKKCDKCLKIADGNHKLTYYVYYQGKLDVQLAKIIKSFQQASALMTYFGITKYINVHMIMAPFRRRWPVEGALISPEHINGGYTATPGNDIFIIRSEEFSKVILHEILHHCPQVHSTAWTQQQVDSLKTAFNVAKDTILIPNEAVVELWATLMHCVFLYFEYGVHWKKLVDVELQYSLQLSNKILKMRDNMQTGWRENTNAFAYIVFKTILLNNVGKIKKWDPDSVTSVLLMHKDAIFKGLKNNSSSLRLLVTSDF